LILPISALSQLRKLMRLGLQVNLFHSLQCCLSFVVCVEFPQSEGFWSWC